MFYFHKVAQGRYLGEMDMFFFMYVKKFLPANSSAKVIKIERVFSKLWSQIYCHVLWDTVCETIEAYRIDTTWLWYKNATQ